MPEEMIDIVDENDNVIGEALRKGIHTTNLKHRAVHIFVFNPEGKLWLEKRSMHVDTFPGHYSSSVAGHIARGESPLTAANREIEEELGFTNLEVKEVHKFNLYSAMANEFITFFTATSPLQPRLHEDATSQELFSLKEIDEKIEKGEKFSPTFLIIYEWYKKNVR